MTVVLFKIYVDILFFFTPYYSAALVFLSPYSIFCKALYFSVIEIFTLFILTKLTTVPDFVVEQKV